MKKFLLALPRWSCTIVALLLLLYLTLVPKPLPDTGLRLFPHADKVIHAIMFGGIYFCLVLDFLRERARFHQSLMLPLSLNLTFAFVAIALGGAIEILQESLAMGRSCDILDFYADVAGVIVFFTFSRNLVRDMLR
ncbi:MAG: hypothetical protein K2J42_07420 [Muribaculaceae bacterium]|nr:hypothetical protein [Muribaculaceae bacterium]